MNPATWNPMEWPARWLAAAKLEMVRQTPINCLLCAAEPPGEFREAAAKAGVACFGPKDAPVVWRPLKEIDWRTAAPVIGVGDGVWPKLDLKQGGTTESAGPTGAPWLDANGWIIQLARSRAKGKVIWVKADPPAENEILTLDDYLLAANEARAYGARRPVWLSGLHIEEMEKGSSAARQSFQRIGETLGWWDRHAEWEGWRVQASLLVISDFAGPNEYMASEILNLSARRNLAFRALTPDDATPEQMKAARGVLYVDQAVPGRALLDALGRFAAAGGLLLAPKETAAKLAGLKLLDEAHPRFRVHALGKGRVAVPKAGWEDPYLVAQDTHLLMSRRWDSVRLFNGGSVNVHHVAGEGKRSVAHLLNYARRAAAHEVLLESPRPVAKATLLGPGREVVELAVRQEMGRYEMPLPPLGVYSAVELEHSV